MYGVLARNMVDLSLISRWQNRKNYTNDCVRCSMACYCFYCHSVRFVSPFRRFSMRACGMTNAKCCHFIYPKFDFYQFYLVLYADTHTHTHHACDFSLRQLSDVPNFSAGIQTTETELKMKYELLIELWMNKWNEMHANDKTRVSAPPISSMMSTEHWAGQHDRV